VINSRSSAIKQKPKIIIFAKHGGTCLLSQHWRGRGSVLLLLLLPLLLLLLLPIPLLLFLLPLPLSLPL
jgi:hypothetical protein